MPDLDHRQRHTPAAEDVREHLCNGETAEKIVVSSAGTTPDKWLLTLDYGWAQTIIATCDYDHDAAGVAAAVAAALECDVEWLA